MTSSILSNLTKSDRNCIEFTRCLYKAKLVVQELEEFSQTVGPTLCLSPCEKRNQYDPRISTDEFTKNVYQYLDDSFRKFNHMCRVLLVVLKKLESNHPIKKERIDSFRQEVLNEWKKALRIKQNLLSFVQYQSSRNSLPSPSSDPEIEDKSSPSST